MRVQDEDVMNKVQSTLLSAHICRSKQQPKFRENDYNNTNQVKYNKWLSKGMKQKYKEEE